jgi:hypothetical protein
VTLFRQRARAVCRISAVLFRHAAPLDHFAPFLDVGDKPRPELFRRRRPRLDAEFEQTLLDLARRQDVTQSTIERLDHLRRCRRRSKQGVPRRDVKIRDAAFLHGRNVGQRLRPVAAGGSDGQNLFALELRFHGRIAVNDEVHVIADERDECFRRAAEWHDGEVQARGRLEQFRGQILGAADIDRAGIKLAWLQPHGLHQRRQGLELAVRIGRNQEIEEAQRRDRREILHRIEWQRLEQRHADRRTVGQHRQCIAICRRRQNRSRRRDTARPGLVLNDEALAKPIAEPFGHDARGDVGDPASAKRQDQPDRPIGVLCGRRSRGDPGE